MSKFRLIQKSSNRLLTKFHVLNEDGDIVGSIGVEPSQASDLLKHWSGPADRSPSVASRK